MPSPSIPRCQSAPRISPTLLSPPHSDVASRRTSKSENSPRTWPKKVSDFIARKTSSSPSPKKSILTEESLKEFNRLNEILEEKRYFNSSPYYKGLTDSSLVISRLRPSLPCPDPDSHAGSSPYYKGLTDSSLVIGRLKPSLPSPDRDSHAGSFISSSSKTSFAYRMQEWGSSCFTSKGEDENTSLPKSSSSKSKNSKEYSIAPTRSLSSSSLSKKDSSTSSTDTRDRCTNIAKELGSERKNPGNFSTNTTSTTRNYSAAIAILNKGKPLRERVFEPPSPPPTPPYLGLHIIPSHPPAALPIQTEPPQPTIQQPPASAQPIIPPFQISLAEKIVQKKEMNPENERKFVWAEKYRPVTLNDFICNRSKALELQAMAKSKNCSHFIFEGQPGVGKRTMIWALLREAYGEDRVEAREETKKFLIKGEAVSSINVNIKQSSKHVEINLSEIRGYEKHVIVELITEKNDKSSDKRLQCHPDNCRAVILYEADKLPTEALLYIKWLLERYKGCNKLFFCCSNSSKIQPLTSVCTLVQLLPPSTEEIINVLEFIAQQEDIMLPHQLASKLANSSKNNLRQAIRSFEATWQLNSHLKEDQEIMTGWEDDIAIIARNIIEEQSPKQLYNIRGKLQNLVEHNVSPEFIFKTLVKELQKNLDDQLQKEIDNLYEKYNKSDDWQKHYSPVPNRPEEMGKRLEDPVRKTVQQFMRIEEFIAKFMSWYKGLVVKNKELQPHTL